MKIETQYVCEICGAKFDTESEALSCEDGHAQPVGFGNMSYCSNILGNDTELKYPKYIHIKFNNGGQLRYTLG